MHGNNLDEDDPAFKILMGLNFYGNDFLNPQGIIPSNPSSFYPFSILCSSSHHGFWDIHSNVFLPVFKANIIMGR